MDRYIVIHGHFYQPPRDNPWFQYIPHQPSAYPYHDWNERINAECYAPNSVSRILDLKGRITRLVNNYEKISFNFGPTLLSWLRLHSPAVFSRIIRADTKSRVLNNGHGNAIAQCYNHIIMPLANRQDKITQIVWGIRDFQFHFGRYPEGMWLPETAVDLETLDIMAERGIRFTILAPHQAKMIKGPSDKRWHPVEPSKLDVSMPYLVKLPTGREIHVFFYHAGISQEIAFGKLLESGEAFAKRLLEEPLPMKKQPPLLCIATDGETYGHHHKFSEMALSYAISAIENSVGALITNPGYCLEELKITAEVQIKENTSWSCMHGVERWRDDCGCSVPVIKGWNQLWRAPLREALDFIRFYFIRVFEDMGGELFHDPWSARNHYIDVMLDENNRVPFLRKHLVRPDSVINRQNALKLLELQKNAMFMYTSCGWFFNDISRIETLQILTYALRAMELYESLTGESLLEGFLDILSEAKSNIKELGTGADIFRKQVMPQVVDSKQAALIGAFHLALEPSDNEYRKGNIKIKMLRHQKDSKKALLEINMLSTQETSQMEVDTSRADNILDIRVVLDDERPYSVNDLIEPEKQEILKKALLKRLERINFTEEGLKAEMLSLLRLLGKENFTISVDLRVPAESFLKNQLLYALNSGDLEAIEKIIDIMKLHSFSLKAEEFEFLFRRFVEAQFKEAMNQPHQKGLNLAFRLLNLCSALPFSINLWTVQNLYYETLVKRYSTHPPGKEFRQLGERLYFNMDAILEQLNE